MQGGISGTAQYMSPEQAEGGIVEGRTDIFAFGPIFNEMLTGVSQFKRDSVISRLSAGLRDQPKPLSEVAGNLPIGADKFIQGCLANQRELRIQ